MGFYRGLGRELKFTIDGQFHSLAIDGWFYIQGCCGDDDAISACLEGTFAVYAFEAIVHCQFEPSGAAAVVGVTDDTSANGTEWIGSLGDSTIHRVYRVRSPNAQQKPVQSVRCS